MLLGASAWMNDTLAPKTVLEVGSGTGIISLMLAQRFPDMRIHAIDISPDAVSLSQTNFQESPWNARLSCSHANIETMPMDQLYAGIIINPPYFMDDTKSSNRVDIQARHMHGMTYASLLNNLFKHLEPGGSIYMIHPIRYLDAIQEGIKNKAEVLSEIHIRHHEEKAVRNVISRIERIKKDAALTCKSIQYLNIQNKDTSFSKDYVRTLKPFLTIF